MSNTDSNHLQPSVQEMLKRLERGLLDLGEGPPTGETFDSLLARLGDEAPPQPEGYDSFRFVDVNWGLGREGMIKTFEYHASLFMRVHSGKARRWPFLLSGQHPYNGELVERLRLLNGDDTHTPYVKWVTTNLQANRVRESVTAVRGGRSLAGAGLALGWLVLERVAAIDYDRHPAWFCAGYESNVPEEDGSPWQSVPCVRCDPGRGTRNLGVGWRSDDSGYSVPELG